MQVHHIGEQNSILNNFIYEIRDENIQKDSMRFRKNIERIGEILAYEMSKTLKYEKKDIVTPLGIKDMVLPENDLVICSILRAGLPLHQGVLNFFDHAQNAFISAYRKVEKDGSFDIRVEYFASPALDEKILILADPMLATGQSLVKTFEGLKTHGYPKELHIIAVIASTDGIEYISKHFADNTHLWVAAIDYQLNKKGYIVPGLGDAGDLSFGSKL
jgi:uracil phosphoribosyltransferase